MKMMKKYYSLAVAFLALFIFLAFKATAEKSDFTYDPSYYWGNQQNDWAACKNGRQQSPININKVRHSDEQLFMSSTKSAAFMQYTEHGVRINWPADGGSLGFDSTLYYFNETRWHIPSEHTINNTRYPLELQLVHTLSYDEQLKIIVSILYNFGSSDPFLSQLESDIEKLIKNPSAIIEVGPLDHPVISTESPFYYYFGSLTTPPCNETATWLVGKEVRPVSPHQVDLLRQAMNFESNSRPVQPINEREVLLCQSPTISQ